MLYSLELILWRYCSNSKQGEESVVSMDDLAKYTTSTEPQGLVHLYFGDGKGKTTAAVGLAVRFVGNDKKVLVAQFFKGRASGEVAILEALPGVTVLRDESSEKFMWEMNEAEAAKYRASQKTLYKKAWELAAKGDFDLLLLDEVLYLPFYQIVDEQSLIESLHSKPRQLEVVLTGRDAGKTLEEQADYITKLENVKHPYDSGIPQRKGTEY